MAGGANRPHYGRTWWGAQWLQALTQIDFDNRLPRGRTYANRGAVRDLVVKDGQIHAHVQGSRPRPYDVTIKVPPVAAADAHRLVDALTADPGLIARLLNRDLDPAVLEVAQRLKIPIFPSTWKDLAMHCSCPDWAVPCKHLAAVIYLLSQEIDGDPFLVFSLRGLDLPRLMAKSGVQIGAAAAPALPSLAELLFANDATLAPGTAAAGSATAAKAKSGSSEDRADPTALQRIDFTTLSELRGPLWRVLAARPVFFRGGDFRELGQRAMERVARHARGLIELPAVDEPGLPLPEGGLQFAVDDAGALHASGVALAGRALTTLPELLTALAAVPPTRIAELSDGLVALHGLRALALHLLAQGAVVPQVFAADASHTGLRWVPAELDATVSGMVALTARALPEGYVQRGAGRKKQQQQPPLPLPRATQARLLLGALLDQVLREADAAAAEKPQGDKVLALFFGSGQVRLDGPGEGAIAGSVMSWLARLHLARGQHLPVLELQEGDDTAAGGGEFALSVSVADEADALAPPTPLAKVLSAAAWAARRFALLQTVAMLAEFHPPLNDYVRGGARRPLALGAGDLPAFLFEALPAMRLLGIRALLPRALERLLRPRLSMRIKAASPKSASGPGGLDANRIFSFDWKVSVGDELITPAEFERLLGKAHGIVRFRGQYIYLDPAEVERLRAQLARPSSMSGADLLRVALAGEVEGAPVALDAAAQKLLEQLKREAEVPLPAGLHATLRPYQQRGYAWLWRNARLGLGSVLADDMGLGKTVQVLTLLLRLKQDGALAEGGALVIVPTSLLTNWQKEAARFAPGLAVAVFHGSKRELGKQRPDVLLTTYGIARTEVKALAALHWRIVVVDEAQNIKNAAAAQARAVKSIAAGSYVAMSGTPVENRLSEYWSIMDFAQRGHLGGAAQFEREYATPIQTRRDAAVAERLKRVLAPFMMRRLKSDKTIIDDLPDKVEQDQFCSLAPAQAALYESVVQEGLKSIAGESDTFQRQGLVLQMILALKQVCNHPAHYLKQGLKAGDAAAANASGKTERLLELLEEILAAGRKVLVFTQFREMGELLQRLLHARFGHEPLFLHGGVARARRDQMVERFQGERSERIFLLSLKAGGTGLNLTAASHVVHFDLWWNPAVEAQATDRAYRIGQGLKVQVHRLITRGTFEERINDMLQSKRELAAMTVGTGETWVGRLPPEELRALFRLG